MPTRIDLRRSLTVAYEPQPANDSFLARRQEQAHDGVTVAAAVMTDRESRQHFGVPMARHGLQPVWIHVANGTPAPVRLDLFSIDAAYYTALEAACVCHFSSGRRLIGFGLLAWLFLPLLPLLVCKLIAVRAANRRMDAHFKQEGFRGVPILPGRERAGIVFTRLDEGTKSLDVRLITDERALAFDFALPVPGLAVRSGDEAAEVAALEPLSEERLHAWATGFARATSNRTGSVEGDPLNLVVAGGGETIRQAFGGRWDLAEAVTLSTCLKTARSFLLDAEYRYSPMSPLYVAGRIQDLALQRARASINERMHLRLWRSPFSFEGAPVWIGQVSRDIGVRFTLRTWNLTTHRIDPDVDEARDYVIDYLLSVGRVSRFGYVDGVGPAAADAPRRNLTGDPYFTDGQRAVLVLSRSRTAPAFIRWT